MGEREPQIKQPGDGKEKEDTDEDTDKNNKKVATSKGHIKAIVPSSPMEGNIHFENVTFSYPTRRDVMVLNGFTLSLAKNTTTALVGSSGSGKSTVVGLIQRFYDVDSGTITLDGGDIVDLDLTWLRSQIGYVQQEPQLFGVSVRENLTYGLSAEQAASIDQADLESACRDANAHEFISSWPDGYDTMVGERGVTLSGGQKQRMPSREQCSQTAGFYSSTKPLAPLTQNRSMKFKRPSKTRWSVGPSSSSLTDCPPFTMPTRLLSWITAKLSTSVPMRSCWAGAADTRT